MSVCCGRVVTFVSYCSQESWRLLVLECISKKSKIWPLDVRLFQIFFLIFDFFFYFFLSSSTSLLCIVEELAVGRVCGSGLCTCSIKIWHDHKRNLLFSETSLKKELLFLQIWTTPADLPYWGCSKPWIADILSQANLLV